MEIAYRKSAEEKKQSRLELKNSCIASDKERAKIFSFLEVEAASAVGGGSVSQNSTEPDVTCLGTDDAISITKTIYSFGGKEIVFYNLLTFLMVDDKLEQVNVLLREHKDGAIENLSALENFKA